MKQIVESSRTSHLTKLLAVSVWLAVASFSPLGSSAFAASGAWNVDAAGNWSTATNWSSNPTVPGTAAGDVVGLNNNISATRKITINSTSRTVGTLNIGDPLAGFPIVRFWDDRLESV